jgi:uncharacterized protein (DUF488 family)
MRLFTIGSAGKGAERFFGLLAGAGVVRVVDVRARPRSQLAGFARQDDLAFLLDAVAGIGYRHEPLLAPTAALLADYRQRRDWPTYERAFLELLRERDVERVLQRGALDRACLLCSEHDPATCHRRLVAEHLQRAWGDVEIVHLQ